MPHQRPMLRRWSGINLYARLQSSMNSQHERESVLYSRHPVLRCASWGSMLASKPMTALQPCSTSATRVPLHLTGRIYIAAIFTEPDHMSGSTAGPPRTSPTTSASATAAPLKARPKTPTGTCRDTEIKKKTPQSVDPFHCEHSHANTQAPMKRTAHPCVHTTQSTTTTSLLLRARMLCMHAADARHAHGVPLATLLQPSLQPSQHPLPRTTRFWAPACHSTRDSGAHILQPHRCMLPNRPLLPQDRFPAVPESYQARPPRRVRTTRAGFCGAQPPLRRHGDTAAVHVSMHCGTRAHRTTPPFPRPRHGARAGGRQRGGAPARRRRAQRPRRHERASREGVTRGRASRPGPGRPSPCGWR